MLFLGCLGVRTCPRILKFCAPEIKSQNRFGRKLSSCKYCVAIYTTILSNLPLNIPAIRQVYVCICICLMKLYIWRNSQLLKFCSPEIKPGNRFGGKLSSCKCCVAVYTTILSDLPLNIPAIQQVCMHMYVPDEIVYMEELSMTCQVKCYNKLT